MSKAISKILRKSQEKLMVNYNYWTQTMKYKQIYRTESDVLSYTWYYNKFKNKISKNF